MATRVSISTIPTASAIAACASYRCNAARAARAFSCDPDAGSPATSFDGGLVPVQNDIGPAANPYDEVAGITVLPDGKVAMVGRSIDANAKDQLLLAQATAMDGLDPAFCGGGVCAHISQDPRAGIDGDSIRVRPSTHDLVVTTIETRSDMRGQIERLQVIEQFSASGITLHGRTEMDYPTALGEDPDATTAGLYVGTDAAGGYAMMIGSTTWSQTLNDYDITVVRTIATDELFASGFGSAGIE